MWAFSNRAPSMFSLSFMLDICMLSFSSVCWLLMFMLAFEIISVLDVCNFSEYIVFCSLGRNIVLIEGNNSSGLCVDKFVIFFPVGIY